MNVIIQIIAGIIGGNAMGAGMQDTSLGVTGNTTAGAAGGVAGGQLIRALLLTSADAGGEGLDDIGYIIGELIGSGAGGAMLTLIVGMSKRAMTSRKTK